jgi:hypothetical protein
LIRGPSFAAGCGILIGRRMGAVSLCYCATLLDHRHHPMSGGMPNGEPSRSGVFRFKSTLMRAAA